MILFMRMMFLGLEKRLRKCDVYRLNGCEENARSFQTMNELSRSAFIYSETDIDVCFTTSDRDSLWFATFIKITQLNP